MNRTVRTAHLVVGLLFLGIAGTWLLHATHVLTTDQLVLSGPVVLIAAGVVGLVVSLAGARQGARGDRPRPVGYDDPSAGAPTPTSIESETKENHHD